MRLVPLTQNQYAIVDDEDFDRIIQSKWCARWSKATKSFYAIRGKVVNGRQQTILMHREVLGLKKGEKLQGDHKNHDTLDNRRCNLRTVTHQVNQWNRKKPKGYIVNPRNGTFRARIRVHDKLIHLGYFTTTKEAHAAYIEAKKIHHVNQQQDKKAG